MIAIKLATLLALLAAPLIQLLAWSDSTGWFTSAGFAFRVADAVLRSPLGFSIVAVLAYNILSVEQLRRAWWSIVPIVLSVVAAMPPLVLFGLALESAEPKAVYLIVFGWFGIFIAFGAVVHHFVLRSGVLFWLEVPAVLATYVIPNLIWLPSGIAGETSTFLGTIQSAQTYLLAGWPALAGLIPCMLILLWRRPALTASEIVIAALVASASVYALKASLDLIAARDMALVWPVRVIQQFDLLS